MPHLAIQYSGNLEAAPMQALCDSLCAVLAGTALYPLGGIRVRALPCPHYAIADRHRANAFVDMVFRIGTGRTPEQKKMTGEKLMAAAESHFAKQLQSPHFALSLEIVEINSTFSWKTNSIHPRLKGQKEM
jgi:5-carboxymethyl-2-hydroxymuconate isomerase